MPATKPINYASAVSPKSAKSQDKSVVTTATKPHEVDELQRSRLSLLLANMVGLTVRVSMQNGKQFVGVFHTSRIETNAKFVVVLRLAHEVSEKRVGLQQTVPFMECADFVAVEAEDMDLMYASQGMIAAAGQQHDGGVFRTDTAISGNAELRERQLTAWQPDAESPLSATQPKFTAGAGKNGWDQFAANEQLFGVRTDYKEELYTTELDRNSREYQQREREAERLAREIEQGFTKNVHRAEERGHQQSGGMTEEQRYGSVQRTNANSYVPPAQRKQQAQSAQAPAKQQQPASDAKLVNSAEPEAPKGKDAQPEKVVKALAKTDTARKPSLDPAASAFSFNLGASEFKVFGPQVEPPPTAAVSATVVEQSPPHNIFGKRVRDLSHGSLCRTLVDRYVNVGMQDRNRYRWDMGGGGRYSGGGSQQQQWEMQQQMQMQAMMQQYQQFGMAPFMPHQGFVPPPMQMMAPPPQQFYMPQQQQQYQQPYQYQNQPGSATGRHQDYRQQPRNDRYS